MVMLRVAVTGALLAGASTAAHAQGTLGAQGFGYPPGQLSVYSRATGGATAEDDALSPINPAAIAFMQRGGLYLQSEQENRSLDAAGQSGGTRAYRFPLFSAALPLGPRAMIAVSFSTLLDRTWGTTTRGIAEFGDETVEYTERFRAAGALNDVRIAGSWALRPDLVVGLGVHLFPGENRLSISRVFDDSLSFAPLRDSSNVNYFGTGYSAGVLWRPNRSFSVGASGRIGSTLKLREGDTLRTQADIPSRFGVGVQYDVFPGTTVAVRADRALWSKMAGLGTERSSAEDTWDFGVGLDAVGPHVVGTDLALRGGVRRRTLPFRAGGELVRETAFTVGTGAPFAGGRASVDFFLERASRSAGDVDAKERSWTFGLGLTVRP
jgi:long-subunit fatty acid transport protein